MNVWWPEELPSNLFSSPSFISIEYVPVSKFSMSFSSTMSTKRNIFVPLIIDGVDVKLPENSLTFTPDSLSASTNATLNVIAQGTDVANCHAAVDSCARAFEPWRATLPVARRTLLWRLAELLRSKGGEILQIMEEEIHATSLWANINLEESILMIQEAAALVTSSSIAGSMPSSQNP
jgi:acyl-CoA reductase-like NAD-dependent aldehyde dehydrogenase